jgi:hypothetical protein
MLYVSEYARRSMLSIKVAKPRKLNQRKQQHLVTAVAVILDRGEPTQFALEATCRHALRSRLCLQGWRWAEADAVAFDIVAKALRRAGAQRPTWAEGQPEHLQNFSGAMIARTRCVRCRKTLPDGHWKFCGSTCSTMHFRMLQRLQVATEGDAYDRVSQSKHLQAIEP